jgi:hypothetical protein
MLQEIPYEKSWVIALDAQPWLAGGCCLCAAGCGPAQTALSSVGRAERKGFDEANGSLHVANI